MLSHLLMPLLLPSLFVNKVLGHGRLEEPPSRSSMWRFGFDNPINYNDHELYCGGLPRQTRNGGRCGVCGDPWDAPTPRPNEDGGKYGRGMIVRTFTPGQTIDVIVDITANHQGHFEFKLCPVTKYRPVDEDCMNQYPLQLADGSGFKYKLPPDSRNEKFPIKLVLPKGFTCNRCVFQWTYTGGNNWGTCKDGTGRIGCGPQETFRACADIAILEETNDVGVNDINQDIAHTHTNSVNSDESGGLNGACKTSTSPNIIVFLISFPLVMIVLFFE